MSGGLEVRGLRRRFGGVAAVEDVDLDVPAGAVTALIGPNGAGKTTLFHCITGLDTADTGTVTLPGSTGSSGSRAPGGSGCAAALTDPDSSRLPLSGLPPHARARAGVAWTFQRIELFAGLTVAENIRVGAENRRSRPLLSGLLGLPDPRRAAVRATVTGVLGRLALSRALLAPWQLLLVDELSHGLSPLLATRLYDVLATLAATHPDRAVVLAEPHPREALALADRVHVLRRGELAATGSPTDFDPATL